MGGDAEGLDTFLYARDWDELEMNLAKYVGIDKLALKTYSIEEFVDLWDKYLDHISKENTKLEERNTEMPS